MSHVLTTAVMDELRVAACERGLVELGAVSLDDPGFEPARQALDAFLDQGWAGEMKFLERSREPRKRPQAMLAGARSLLVALVPYRGRSGPVARYAQSGDYHTLVHRRLSSLAKVVREVLPGVETLVCVDTKPVLERTAAALAGLGFLGKHGCLIAPGLGSFVLIGCVLCTASVEPATGPVRPDRARPPWEACGTCRACLDACPTAAFVAPGRLDPRRCISYLTIEHRGEIKDELADRIGERVAGCDACQEVCPYNLGELKPTRVPAGAWLEPAPGPERVPELARLAQLGNNQHRAFVKHTALNRIPRRSLRRNALIALGNRPGPLDAVERDVCERAAADPDPQVRSAAARALARRGSGAASC